jgi:hypothetical protein
MPRPAVITAATIGLVVAIWLMVTSKQSTSDGGDQAAQTELTNSAQAKDRQPTDGSSEAQDSGSASNRTNAVAETFSVEKVDPQSGLPIELSGPEDFLALVNLTNVTHTAVRSGAWNDPATWGGQLPIAGAAVHIPADMEITIGDQDTAHLKSLRLEGTLQLAPTEEAQLNVDTLVVNTEGTLRAGSATQPLAADVEALVNIEAYPDPSASPVERKHSAQLISLGTVDLNGTPKTGLAILTMAPMAGDQELLLKSAPQNWKAGDLLILGGDRTTREEGESLQIKYVTGNRVGLAPAEAQEGWKGLLNDYDTSKDHLGFAVNISRNVAVSSPKPTDGYTPAGAAIFYGDAAGKTTLSGVGIYGLGSQDVVLTGQSEAIQRPALTFQNEGTVSTQPTAPQQDLAAVLSTGANARLVDPNDPTCLTPTGAIGLPANRIGSVATGPAAHIAGIAVVDAPPNAISIQDAPIQISNTVAYDDQGAAWVTSNGSNSRLLWTSKRSSSAMPSSGLPAD